MIVYCVLVTGYYVLCSCHTTKGQIEPSNKNMVVITLDNIPDRRYYDELCVQDNEGSW